MNTPPLPSSPPLRSTPTGEFAAAHGYTAELERVVESTKDGFDGRGAGGVLRISDSVTLILGDCASVLPTIETADAMVTDPPFGIGFDYGDAHDDDPLKYEAMMKHLVSEAGRIVSGACFVWQGMPQCAQWHRWFPAEFRIMAACKGFVQYRPTPVQWSFDPVIFWGRPGCEPSVYRKDWHVQSKAPFGANRPRIDHPCPRPLEQVEYVVDLASLPGQTVIDPFMGSGTTGVACIRGQRKFIGIEKDPKHFQTAVQRMRSALEECVFEFPKGQDGGEQQQALELEPRQTDNAPISGTEKTP